jgi:glutamate N-acetyltransferase/amino-acid N-acetyltransferase
MTNIRISGFKFSGVSCGIKTSKKKDLAMIFSERPATAAALFTTNAIKSPAVLVGRRRLTRGELQAVVINSGNANACTGARGMRDAQAMCRKAGSELSIHPKLIVPSSTGIIGVPLPMENVLRGIEKAVARLSGESFLDAAEAIMTTDRFIKVSSTHCFLGRKNVRVAGMVKGAGMIAPKMATMLAYILTDASVELDCLRAILKRCADRTFNCVTVDGDMSTNDTVLFLANGAGSNSPVRRGSREERVLNKAVKAVMKDLALKLVEDGEGTTKVVEILVQQTRSVAEAKKIALAVANSQLVKTAFFGEDPNFGRIMMAVGGSGVKINAEKIDVFFNDVCVVRKGVGLPRNESQAARVLKLPSFVVKIRLCQGKSAASVWTSDLSHAYVRINSAYRT